MICFSCCGHPNITARHKTTIEFTKDKNLTLKGDCIIGVNSDFNLKEIKCFIKKSKKAKLMIKSGSISEEINFDINPGFDDSEEIVIRKSSFISKRTLGINADKACSDLNKALTRKLKDRNTVLDIIIT